MSGASPGSNGEAPFPRRDTAHPPPSVPYRSTSRAEALTSAPQSLFPFGEIAATARYEEGDVRVSTFVGISGHVTRQQTPSQSPSCTGVQSTHDSENRLSM